MSIKNKHLKKILNDDNLNNTEFVKSYLEFSFKYRKPKKDYKVYINICKMFSNYPNTIKDLLDNIPTRGYYKDYFYILMFSRNNEMDDYIYNIIIKQINEDLEKLQNKKQISTLGKWLPRENCKINKQCNFIDKFTARFYPNIENKFTARKRYRKLKTNLNIELGTLEAKMCTQQYDTIDFNKVSQMSLKRNMSGIIKHENCKIKLDDYETLTLKKMSLSEFTNQIITGNHPIDKIIDLWEHNRYRMEIPYVNNIIQNSACIIDLSKDTFCDNGEYFALGLALLVDQFSTLNIKVIICNNNVMDFTQNEKIWNVQEKAKHMFKYVGSCKPIDALEYYEMICERNKNNNCKNLIFVTNKEINNIEALNEKNVVILKYSPYGKNYDITYYNGDKVRYFTKYDQYSNDSDKKLEKTKNIAAIINTSSELNDRKTPIYIITILLTIWLLLQLYRITFL